MNRSKKRYLLLGLLPATMVITGLVGYLLLNYLLPDSYFRWYPLIPSYFTLLALLIVPGMVRFRKSKPAQGLMIYLASRIVKMILTTVSVFLYYQLVGQDMKVVLLATFVFYLLFLTVEIPVFYRLGKDV